jgi:rare lipoprotein A (peptidoglycan hydrolase)
LRFYQICLAALIAVSGHAAISPATAQDVSLSSMFSELMAAPPTTTGWTATVVREEAPAVAAKDPFWTAVVYARRDTRIETGSVAQVAPATVPRVTGTAHTLTGTASYYWQDQMTASGEVFNKRDMTAAHKTLPLGTKVRVTNLGNGRSTIVRINDRGPYIGGRVIDLSEAAADVLGMRTQGLAPVRVDLIGQ